VLALLMLALSSNSQDSRSLHATQVALRALVGLGGLAYLEWPLPLESQVRLLGQRCLVHLPVQEGH